MDLSSSSLHFENPRDELIMYEEERSFGLVSEESFVSVGFGGDYMNGEYHERSTILVDGGEHFGVSALAFDSHEELLWMGNQGGHVTSYYGGDLEKYTSFQVHATDEVRALHTVEGGLLALTPSTLRYQMRRGIPLFTHASENMEEMQCLLQLNNSPDTLLLGGHTRKLIELNLHQGREVETVTVGEGGCAILRHHNRFICCGDPTGQIELRDPHTLRVEHSLETHTGSLSDFDVHGHLLVSCGFSNRQGTLAVDNLLLVYDLRMLRSVAPISILVDPLLLRFMPSFSSRLAVASPLGQLQFVETVTLSEPDMTIYHVNSGNSVMTALDVSSSSQAVCMGNGGGSLHLLTSGGASPLFNAYSRPTELPDPIHPYEPISMDDAMAVYSSVPLPLTSGALLSDWPNEFLKKQYRRTPMIDPEILRTMKMQGTIGYAPNPNTKRRNQVPVEYTESGGKGRLGDCRGGKDEGTPGFVAIPKRYRKPDMKHLLKFIEELPLEEHHRSKFCGLEANLPNSYCNSMLQVLYFTESLRTVIQSHGCRGEFCVCCELGFLFHMMVNSGGVPCHSGNLLRALRSAKEASALHLILSDNPTQLNDANYILLIQSWNRFILHQLHSELLECKRKGKEVKPAFVYRDTDFPSIDLPAQKKSRSKIKPEFNEDVLEDSTKGETDITRLFGSKQEHVFTCLKCTNKGYKEATHIVLNLSYPNLKGEQKEVSFCDVVKNSMGGSQVTPAWCDPCHKFQPTMQERRVRSLPQILSVNCGNNNESDKKFWKEQIDTVVVKAMSGGAGDVRPSGKQCRYGNTCTRIGCRFKHPQQSSESAPVAPAHLYYSHSWVPSHIRLSINTEGDVSVEKVEESQLDQNYELGEGIVQSLVYDLYAVVCFVNDERKNIVSIINVGPLYHKPSTGSDLSQWYIFNDFNISAVGGHEAVWFSLDWKVPCVLYWEEHGSRKRGGYHPTTSPLSYTPDLFVDAAKCSTITPLGPHEILQPGDLVAMDAEFVTLNQEESELRSDGKLATIKPSQMSVARISCVRGQGPLEGTAFIDDYISTQEQVFDYLTKFSGIKPGDLDVTCSSKHLTTLKSTYLKLRYLIDTGVKFVGHGLKNDFRVINLVVPADQVIDTVHLFHLAHQRMVSLRFLAWHFLGVKIQSETHDSIEDARSALELYKKYQELERAGELRASLEEMYTLGKSLMWKVPGDDS